MPVFPEREGSFVPVFTSLIINFITLGGAWLGLSI